MVLSAEIQAKVKQLKENAEEGAHMQNVQNIMDPLQEENLVYTTKIQDFSKVRARASRKQGRSRGETRLCARTFG